MSRIPKPEPGGPLYPDGSSAAPAIVEVVIVAAFFILAAQFAAANLDLTAIMPGFLNAAEKPVGSTLMIGAGAQAGLVLLLSLLFGDLRRAIRNSVNFGTISAWGAALIAIGIHASTIAFFFLDEPGRILELSNRNLFLSSTSAFDGWSQEVFFRGFVIYRLARGGAPAGVQISLSALLFAAIHFGYTGADFFSVFWPLIGTAVLGAFFSWSVLLARGALLPVVISHALLIMIVQPWLALA